MRGTSPAPLLWAPCGVLGAACVALGWPWGVQADGPLGACCSWLTSPRQRTLVAHTARMRRGRATVERASEDQ